MNWVLPDPAATVTLAGTLTSALPLDKLTANPPVEAASFSVTVQEEDPGAFTLAGVQDKLLSVVAVFKLTEAVLVSPP